MGHRSRFTHHLLVALLLAALAGSAADAYPADGLLRGPYLQQATPESIVIVWRTARPIQPVVKFGTRLERLERRVDRERIELRVAHGLWGYRSRARLHSAPPGTHQYEAAVTGLTAGTTYYYAVYDGDDPLAGRDPAQSFTTSPPKGARRRFGFCVLGDSGTGDKTAREVYDAIREYVEREDFPLDFVLHVGDMAYWDGLDREFQAHYFEMYDELLRNTVWWTTLGNHEGHTANGHTGRGPYFDAFVLPAHGEAGGVPSGTEAYYAFDYANAHFVCLNSYDLDRRPGGRMASWLREDLAQVDAEWLIAFWHHAPYSRGTHDSGREHRQREIREYIVPILEGAGVDVVFTGHSHIYERSMLMNGAYETPARAADHILDDGDGNPAGDGPYRKSAGLNPHEGAVYVVTGQGGGHMFRLGAMPVMRRSLVEHGAVFVMVEGDTLTARMVNVEGRVRDRFSIVKRGTVEPTRIARPWQPLGPYIRPEIPVFIDSIEVSLSSATQWEGEEIRYTLDGSDPTKASPLYTGAPITITNDTWIRARAFRPEDEKGGPVSAAAYHRYRGPLRAPRFGLSETGLVPGVEFAFYEGRWSRLPDFRAREAAWSGTRSTIGVGAMPETNHCAVRFSGYFRAPADGISAFYLSSDAGSRLLMGGQVVVDNDGLYAVRERTGYVGLAAGYHPFEVHYFEAEGAQ